MRMAMGMERRLVTSQEWVKHGTIVVVVVVVVVVVIVIVIGEAVRLEDLDHLPASARASRTGG